MSRNILKSLMRMLVFTRNQQVHTMMIISVQILNHFYQIGHIDDVHYLIIRFRGILTIRLLKL